jgi:hypothetical protein
MKLLPRSPAFERGVQACLKSWRVGGSAIDVQEVLPGLARGSGLRVESFRTRARVGAVGSLEWRWIEQFFESYLPKLVERGQLLPAELEAWRADWRERAQSDESWCLAPTMADLVLRRA